MGTQYLTDSVAVKKDSGEILFLKHDTCADADKFPMKDNKDNLGVRWIGRNDIQFIQTIQSNYG